MIIRRGFEEQLGALQSDLLRLGRFVEESLGKSIDALVRQDMTLGIQMRTMQLLALQQPMARDLRLVAASMRIVVDLERIGDHATAIAKVTRRLAGQSYFKPLVDIPRLGEMSRKMVGDSLRAFVSHDTALAMQVAADDDGVDELCDYLQRELMDKMRADASLVDQATQLLLVARALERVGDHATNIVENIYYVETGEMRPLAREAHQEHEQALAAQRQARGEAFNGEAAGSVDGSAILESPDHHRDEDDARASGLPSDLPATLVDSVDELSRESGNNGLGQNGTGH
jgi:phosphate transport system protein